MVSLEASCAWPRLSREENMKSIAAMMGGSWDSLSIPWDIMFFSTGLGINQNLESEHFKHGF